METKSPTAELRATIKEKMLRSFFSDKEINNHKTGTSQPAVMQSSELNRSTDDWLTQFKQTNIKIIQLL